MGPKETLQRVVVTALLKIWTSIYERNHDLRIKDVIERYKTYLLQPTGKLQ